MKPKKVLSLWSPSELGHIEFNIPVLTQTQLFHYRSELWTKINKEYNVIYGLNALSLPYALLFLSGESGIDFNFIDCIIKKKDSK